MPQIDTLRSFARAGQHIFRGGRHAVVFRSPLLAAAALPPALALSRCTFPSFGVKAFSSIERSAKCEETKGASSSSLPPVIDSIPAEVNLKDCKVRLYQFESCPFCRKARGCLDYENIPYQIVEVHPLNKAETKDIAPDYKKVPILAFETKDGQTFQLRDSKTIVKALLGSKNPGVASKVPPPTVTPSTGKMWTDEEQKKFSTIEEQWIHWTDKVLVQSIVLNVYRNMKESAETFKYLLTHSEFPWFAQRSAAWSGTVVMYAVAKLRKSKYAVPDVRVALYEACNSFADAVTAGGGEFMGGAQPGAVDFNVYGILRSTEGCQTERDLLASCPAIVPWYTAMQQLVGPSKAVNKDSVKRGPSA